MPSLETSCPPLDTTSFSNVLLLKTTLPSTLLDALDDFGEDEVSSTN